ncbi:ras-related protein Rap-2c isoform X1 [Camelus ferus]|uniref:Ras-related protein Rap-2c isoform X1 n=1 Tax=Camelus ferus TaxID=419612 RepID=A0A8B8SKS2_CAMFR|nr:ras-related protein Rap-2c isoform X1 [Camelus ferus]
MGRGGAFRGVGGGTVGSSGRRAENRRTLEVLREALCQGHSPEPKPSPAVSARQGAAPEPPGSPRRGGTFPTGSDPVQSRGTGAPQPVCQGNPSGCALGGWGGVGEKKKSWVRQESQRPPPPPPDGPRLFPLCEPQRRGGGETEEPAGGHGLGVTEPPGRPGGCGRQGRTTPAGAAAQRPARAATTGAEPTGLGRLGGATRKRGPWAPLCEGRGRGAGQPLAAGSADASLTAGDLRQSRDAHPFPLGGAFRPPPPGLLPARPLPTPPAWASVPIGRASPSHPHPPDTSLFPLPLL